MCGPSGARRACASVRDRVLLAGSSRPGDGFATFSSGSHSTTGTVIASSKTLGTETMPSNLFHILLSCHPYTVGNSVDAIIHGAGRYVYGQLAHLCDSSCHSSYIYSHI